MPETTKFFCSLYRPIFIISVCGIVMSARAETGLLQAEELQINTQLTPAVIQEVEQDITQPLEEQNKKHLQKAREQAGQMQATSLEGYAASDYELQRKVVNSKKPAVEQQASVQYMYKNMTVEPSVTGHGVRVETQDHITIYYSQP